MSIDHPKFESGIGSQEGNYENIIAQIENVLTLNESETQLFINKRLETLQKDAKPAGTISHIANNHHEGIILPVTEIKRTPFLDGFKVDDPEIYSILLNIIRDLKQASGWQQKTTREIIPMAIQTAISKYFGNMLAGRNTEELNQEFYLDHSSVDSEPINLRDLKEKGFAVCAEKAALAQNLLSFVGLQPEMIMAECELISGKKEQHSFNTVTTKKGHSIFDPTNPKIFYDKEGKIVNYSPAIYSINDEQHEQLKSGGKIELSHIDYKQDAAGNWHPIEAKRIYGG